MQQLNIFDGYSQAAHFQLLDKVKVIEVPDESEIYEYRKHYFPNIIGAVGEVVGIHGNEVIAAIRGEHISFDARELEWLG